MLHQLLHEIEQATSPITIQELSHRLNLEPGVVAELVAFWVRKGRLAAGTAAAPTHAHHCGGDCQGPAACHFIACIPDQYALRK